MHFVYALVDPRTDIVAYIGITNNAYERFKQHISCRDENGKKNAWIQQLQDEKVIPGMKIIKTVETVEQARELEIYWIRYYLDQGVVLHNIRIDNDAPFKKHKKVFPPAAATSEKRQTLRPPISKDPMKTLRVRLDYWMTRKGITVEELASTANVSTETLAKIRNRGHIPQPAVLKRLANTLGISTEKLVVDVREEQESRAHHDDEKVPAA